MKAGDLMRTKGTTEWGEFVLLLSDKDRNGAVFVLRHDGKTAWISPSFLQYF